MANNHAYQAKGKIADGAVKSLAPLMVLSFTVVSIFTATDTGLPLPLPLTPALAKPAKTQAKTAPRQVIYSLSQEQQNSEALKVWGVPACVLMGKERPRGLYITGFTGDGLGNQLGLEVGDVLLSLNGHVLLGAKQADAIMASTRSGQLKAVVARASSAPGGVSLMSPRINFTADALSRSYSGAGSSSTSSSGGMQSGSFGNEMSVDELENFMFNLVNDDRKANGGIHPLNRSRTLDALARKYADDMKKRDFFRHDDPDGLSPTDRARRAGITVSVWENLAMENGTHNFKALVYRGEAQMMAEAPNMLNHRGCILREQHHCVGIGVAIAQGKVYCVQEFSPADLP